MKKIASFIRSIVPVNRMLRNFLRFSDRMLAKMIRVWHLHGVVTMDFDNVPFKMYSNGDDNIAQLHFFNIQYHELEDLRFFAYLSQRMETVFDVGANTGLYTIYSEKKNPRAKIYAFEPYHINLERLKKNLQLNDSKAIVVEKALGDKITTVDFAVRDFDVINDSASVNVEYSKRSYGGTLSWRTIKVEQTTIDLFCQENKIDRVDLVKIDVEGYEEAVFKGAGNIFRTSSPVIQCEIVLDDEKKIFFDRFLKEFDYCAYMLMRDGILRIDQDMQENPGRVNYLFAKGRTAKTFNAYINTDSWADQLLTRNSLKVVASAEHEGVTAHSPVPLTTTL